jgi:hypothetical protein
MIATARNYDVEQARCWASFYRARGFNPLPSREDDKRPLVRFAHLWEEMAPADLFDRHPTTNIQVMTGRAWRLLVIDLDGPDAPAKFGAMGRCPRTWETHSGGDGRHLWFLLPEGFERPLPKAFLWRGADRHSAIERLCDHSLIMAPPSIHPRTGARYRFRAGRSPKDLPLPATCPAWVLGAKPVEADGQPRTRKPRLHVDFSGLGDKAALAQSWGLRIAGPARQSGWVPCHAIGREDAHPSAAIHQESGYYVDSGSGLRLRLPELAVELGRYLTVDDAVRELAR